MAVIQLFDPASSSFTYVVYDPASREAAIIDPVLAQIERDSATLREHALVLRWSIETHAHADHVTGTGVLAHAFGATSAAPTHCGIPAAQRQIVDRDVLAVGSFVLQALHTPGHTAGSTCYLLAGDTPACVFTGDTLLIDGCGRTDFQSGSAQALFDSVQQRLFTLADDTVVYPGHDYAGRVSSTIGHERQHNARFAGRSRAEFVELMSRLDLPPPRLIDTALPANRKLGLP
jgi:glyoxylase-like metal-dependent hydrolase (beta-lactamase superfamily II)